MVDAVPGHPNRKTTHNACGKGEKIMNDSIYIAAPKEEAIKMIAMIRSAGLRPACRHFSTDQRADDTTNHDTGNGPSGLGWRQLVILL